VGTRFAGIEARIIDGCARSYSFPDDYRSGHSMEYDPKTRDGSLNFHNVS